MTKFQLNRSFQRKASSSNTCGEHVVPRFRNLNEAVPACETKAAIPKFGEVLSCALTNGIVVHFEALQGPRAAEGEVYVFGDFLNSGGPLEAAVVEVRAPQPVRRGVLLVSAF